MRRRLSRRHWRRMRHWHRNRTQHDRTTGGGAGRSRKLRSNRFTVHQFLRKPTGQFRQRLDPSDIRSNQQSSLTGTHQMNRAAPLNEQGGNDFHGSSWWRCLLHQPPRHGDAQSADDHQTAKESSEGQTQAGLFGSGFRRERSRGCQRRGGTRPTLGTLCRNSNVRRYPREQPGKSEADDDNQDAKPNQHRRLSKTARVWSGCRAGHDRARFPVHGWGLVGGDGPPAEVPPAGRGPGTAFPALRARILSNS